MKKILYSILIMLAILLLILIYARFVGTSGLDTNEISIKSMRIDKSYSGLKIVHFSDLHYKNNISKNKIKSLVNEINVLKPDLVVFTGDLIDNNSKIKNEDIAFLIEQFSKIESKYGKFSVIGDDDYLKTDTVKNIYIQSNFNLLNNSYSIIYNENKDKIFIGGLGSYNYEEANIDSLMNSFKDSSSINFKIIILHEGDYIKEITTKYKDIDLILAGHSINGSINIPIIKQLLLPDGARKYYNSYYKLGDTRAYVSNGVGLNDYNFRLFNHPSINFYRIKDSN